MRIRDFVLLAYLAFDKIMQGKTLLQKRVYLLGVMLGRAKELGFRAHYYGPFSAEVADANIQLKSLGFLSETVAGGGAVGPGGFEIARHDYMLTSAGEKVAELRIKESSEEWQRIREAAETIKSGGQLNYMQLSVAAKAYFLLQEKGGKSSLSEIQGMAPLFGWNVSQDELQEAASFLKKIGMISEA